MTEPARIRTPRPMRDLPGWAMPLIHAILALALFNDVLFQGSQLAGRNESDLQVQYLPFRQFGFGVIRHGNFPLWNPHIFAGTPFFADPQSALLYPPNWIHLILPPVIAANWLIAAHLFLAAWLCGLWSRSRGVSVVGSTLAGIVYACCGPIMANLMAGHLPLLCSAAWLPLLAWSIDGVLAAKNVGRWLLAGATAVALLAVDGYPQFIYISTLAAGLYVLVRLPATQNRRRAVLGLAGIFALGWGLSAMQLIASAELSRQSNRTSGLPYDQAVAFSLPPESLLTLFAPGFFGTGNGGELDYWGKWYVWETNVFVGAGALFLAAYALTAGRDRKQAGVAVGLALAFLLPALGPATPVHWLMYHFLPGFDSFRAPARFCLLSMLCLSLLSGLGLDTLRESRPSWRFIACALTAGFALIIAGFWMSGDGGTRWCIYYLQHVIQPEEVYFNPLRVMNASFVVRAARDAGGELAWAGFLVAICAGFLILARRSHELLWCVVAITIAQIVMVAFQWRVDSPASSPLPIAWLPALQAHDPANRVVATHTSLLNAGMAGGSDNVAGYDPLILQRTADFLSRTQGETVQTIASGPDFTQLPSVYRMLRADILFPRSPGPTQTLADPMGHLALIGTWKQIPSAEEALSAVTDPAFDPREAIVLESAPQPLPSPGEGGSARILSESTDRLEISADLPAPKILLVTDAWAAGWMARPMSDESQSNLTVLPADYMLRGIPLGAGHHHFLLEYRPFSVEIGKWISIAAILAYLGVAITVWRRSRRIVSGL